MIVVCVPLVAFVAVPTAGVAAPWDDRVSVLEAEASILAASITDMNDALGVLSPRPPAALGSAEPVLRLAQSSRETAALNFRLSTLEEQIRLLTGQVEGLQFQMTQFQNLMINMQEDYEFRFQQLEGGGLGKTDAVTPSSGAMPVGGLPQDEADSAILGAPEAPLGALDEGTFSEIETGAGQPLDLSFDPGAMVVNADADAQYRAGFDAVMGGDYQFAEDQFRQFVALFPDHPQAPDATNWLGEALIQRGAYDEAAEVLLNGFQDYADSTRGADLLLKLGIALTGSGERDTACRTFGELLRRYPDITPAFKERLVAEQRKAQC